MNYSRKKIEELHDSGKKLKYLFFWGHQPSRSGEITSSCFSQWWQANFTVDDINYPTAEHWMMTEKARLFNDEKSLEKIVNAKLPAEAKKLGRKIVNFDQQSWENARYQIVVKGNYFKFTQNKELENYLLGTKNRVIVEASPVDPIWGIGLDSKSEFATIPSKWRGLNLLGFALMEVRDMIINGDRPDQ